MMISSYRFLSEFILKAHYGGFPPNNAAITQRQVAERIAVKVAKYATVSAYQNGKLGETTYSSDQFISVFNNVALQTDADTGNKYATLPATPAGLPNNQEIDKVSFSGSPNLDVWPMRNKDQFAQNGQKIPGVALYMVEHGRVVFPDLPAIVNGPVNFKLVGAISGAILLDAYLNVPKDVEDGIVSEILQELAPPIKRELIADSEPRV